MQLTAMLQPQHQHLYPTHTQQRSNCCPATLTQSSRTDVSASTATAAAQQQHHHQQQQQVRGSTGWRGHTLQHAARVPVAAPTTPRTAAVLKAASAPATAAAPAAETADASNNAGTKAAAQRQSLDVLEWRSVCRQVRAPPTVTLAAKALTRIKIQTAALNMQC